MADPVSTIWPKPVADFISHDGPGLGIKKVAILYSTNEFTGTQANAFRKFVKDFGAPIEIVYDQGIPTETTNYTVIINNINNTHPDAVIHFGYAPNDIAFLRNVQDVGIKFKMLFCDLSGSRNRTSGKERRRQGPGARFHLRAAVGAGISGQLRHEDEGLQGRLGQEIHRRQDRIRLQRGCRLYHRAGDREDAVGRQQPRSDGVAQGGVQASPAISRRSTAPLRSTRRAARSAS